MKKFTTTTLLLLVCMVVVAQTRSAFVSVNDGLPTVGEQIASDPQTVACNYYAYPGPRQQKLTKAPKGYKPFYLSHYGRHGSRWLIGNDEYTGPCETLERAHEAGVLTQLGEETLGKLRVLAEASHLRLGELTQRGAEQHRGIGRRMYERFPEVFKGSAHIDAKSTDVIRCILSMENALQELSSLNPKLKIKHDASQHEMYYMNRPDSFLDHTKFRPEVQTLYDDFCNRHSTHATLMPRLFTSESYWKENVDAKKLTNQLYRLAANMQSLEQRHEMSLYNLFTPEEIYENWKQVNAWWYLAFGPAPQNQGMQPLTQAALLRNIIETADTCVVLPHPGATLRYGHEVDLLPLACLLEADHFATQTDDLEQLDEIGWHSQRIFPMACNLQFVFYRSNKPDAPVLVKVLLNENEVRLPLPDDLAPYYCWSDFRTYFMDKLNNFEQWKKTAQR